MIGDWIKEQRLARNWTQAQLSEYSGVDTEYIRHLEKNRRPNPGSQILRGLADAFGMTVDQAMIDAGLVPSPAALAALHANGVPQSELDELARIWPDLTEEDRQTALNVMRALWARGQERKHRRARKTPPKQEATVG